MTREEHARRAVDYVVRAEQLMQRLESSLFSDKFAGDLTMRLGPPASAYATLALFHQQEALKPLGELLT